MKDDISNPVMKIVGVLGAILIVTTVIGGVLPGWAQLPAMGVVAAVMAFGILSGGVPGMMNTVQLVFKWTWPFWIWSVARAFLMITPIAAIMPEDRYETAINVTAPVLVSIAGFLFWRFARFQELARDVGVILSLIVHVLTIGAAVYQGEMARDTWAWALGSVAITLGIAAVVYLPPQRTVFSRAGALSALAAVGLTVSVLIVPVKPVSEVIAEKLNDRKEILVEKIARKAEEAGVSAEQIEKLKAVAGSGLEGLAATLKAKAGVLKAAPQNQQFQFYPVDGETAENLYGRTLTAEEAVRHEILMSVSDVLRMEIRTHLDSGRKIGISYDYGAVHDAVINAQDALAGAGYSAEEIRISIARAYVIELKNLNPGGGYEVGPFAGYIPNHDIRVGWEHAQIPFNSRYVHGGIGANQLNFDNRPGLADKKPFYPLGSFAGMNEHDVRYVEPLDLSNTMEVEVLENE